MAQSLLQNYINANKKPSEPKMDCDFPATVAAPTLSESENRFGARNRMMERSIRPKDVYLLFVDDKRLDENNVDYDVLVFADERTAVSEFMQKATDYIHYYDNLPARDRDEMDLIYEENKRCCIVSNYNDIVMASIHLEKKPLK